MRMRNLLRSWPDIAGRIKGKFIYLFLDYDGTLAPISDRPQLAMTHAVVRGILRRLAKQKECALVIISGRMLKDLKRRLPIKGITFIGDHGFEIRGPAVSFTKPLPQGARKALAVAADDILRKLKDTKGVIVEKKNFTVSVHYRLVGKDSIPAVQKAVRETIASSDAREKVRIKEGKKVLELGPAVEWDKGAAISWLMAKHRYHGPRKERAAIFPIYIGDDRTDEDAFRVLAYRGATAVVGKKRGSLARYYLRDTGEVKIFLRNILNIFKG